MSRIVNKLLSTTGGVAAADTDADFANVSLLLHGDGTNGSQNNTFLDSSSNNFTITRNGNTTQGSFSPYGDRWSNYFAATTDYLSYTNSTVAGKFEGADFTLETWVYVTDGSSDQTFYSARDGANQNGPLFTVLSANQKVAVLLPLASGTWGINTFTSPEGGSVPLNQWSHIAITREGTSLRVFINGVLQYTKTINFSIYWPSTVAIISGDLGVGVGFTKGHMSDLRMVKGTALYTANFTPPTEPLTAVTGTILLTCQSNRFKDNSSNDFAITVNGDTKVTPFSPYAPSAAYTQAEVGGSGYFDGTGDYLSVSTGGAFGTNSWTIEAWVYRTGTGTTRAIFDHNTSSSSSTGFAFVVNSSEQLGAYWSGSYQATVNNFPSNQWVHVAATYDGTNLRLFVNGELGATSAESINFTTDAYFIGSSDANQDWLGYISDVRIVNGTALYTAAFTPPTAPLTAVTNTSLLCNFTNAGIFDSTGKNVLETVGNAQIDTAVTKFGTGSMEFDGSTGYLTALGGNDFEFGTGDFTIEFWVNSSVLTTSTIDPNFVDFRPENTNGAYPAIFYDASANNLAYYVNTAVRINGGALSENTWYHVAVCRSGTNTKMFVDGTQVGSTYTDTTNYLVGANRPTIGSQGFTAGRVDRLLTGYIDDLRITKGVARYTANFTPPTKAFPDQ